jgi:N-acetylmuramoyl-L-alanine amidase
MDFEVRKAVRHLGLLAALYVLSGSVVWADGVNVHGARLWSAPDGMRLVFDLEGPVRHKIFALSNPDRIVIDIADSRLGTSLDTLNLRNTPLQRVRSGVRNRDDLRLVLDMEEMVKYRTLLLKPNREYGYRLVVDLDYSAERVARQQKPVVTQPAGERDIVVAIDAGHGGEDPGAHGKHGTREKDVVIAIAKRLARLVEQQPGMRAVMIREGDYFMALRQRIAKARKYQADLFISIHADAFRDARVSGSSVYTLSANGASSEAARWLAQRENSADLIGGLSLEDKDDTLASVLLDLAQTASNEASLEIASSVLGGLKRVGNVHRNNVQQAGFVVLKSPDIPSILVETAFISNPSEERKLKDARYQQQLAQAIFSGVNSYFVSNPPAGTTYAARRRHIISRGDTLGKIAQRYRVSIHSLRQANHLSGDRILPGQVLHIPTGRDS